MNNSRITCLLPKTIHPTKEAFKSLGFTFKDIDNQNFCLATLPVGWKSVASKENDIILIDKKARQRASYLYEGNNINMRLHKRFSMQSEHINPEHYQSPVRLLVKDHATGEIIFIAGQCENEICTEFENLILKARNYLNEHYPGWKDPTKYWD